MWARLASIDVLGMQPRPQTRGRHVALMKCPAGHVTTFKGGVVCGKAVSKVGIPCPLRARPVAVHHPATKDKQHLDPWKEFVALKLRTSPEMRTVEKPLDEALRIDMHFRLDRPKTLMRKKDPDDPVWHSKRPDKDNLEKPVLDVMQAIGWLKDDARVCEGLISKHYRAKYGESGVLIDIFRWMQKEGGTR